MLNIAPTATPPALLLEEAKLHLRVDHADEDALILGMIVAATAEAEHTTGRKLVTQTWQVWLPGWPPTDSIPLALSPVASITHIKYSNLTGVEQTLSAADYELVPHPVSPFVQRLSSAWPAVHAATPYPVRITLQAGYGLAAQVPEAIRAWIKCKVGALYLHRESAAAGAVADVPFVDRLLDGYRTWGT